MSLGFQVMGIPRGGGHCLTVIYSNIVPLNTKLFTKQFGTQVPKCLQFERLLNVGLRRQDVLHGPAQPWQNFPLCRRRPSYDSRAVGR